MSFDEGLGAFEEIMAGVFDRVKGFLDSWPIVEKHLNEILQEGIRDGNRSVDESFRGGKISKACGDYDLQACRE
jgi:hypothetical protein